MFYFVLFSNFFPPLFISIASLYQSPFFLAPLTLFLAPSLLSCCPSSLAVLSSHIASLPSHISSSFPSLLSILTSDLSFYISPSFPHLPSLPTILLPFLPVSCTVATHHGFQVSGNSSHLLVLSLLQVGKKWGWHIFLFRCCVLVLQEGLLQ